MAKFYVESGTLQLITDADDARGAALWAVHCAMEQVMPVCQDDPRTPQEKSEHVRQRGCYVLSDSIAISERGFGRKNGQRFDTAELFAEWNQLMIAIAKLQKQLQVVA